MFKKVTQNQWRGESEHYVLDVTKNGHCGYYLTLTHKVSGKQHPRYYGGSFKALTYWVEKFEGWVAEGHPCVA